MTYQRLAYDDAASTTEMASDATRVGEELRLSTREYAGRRHRGPSNPPPATPEVSAELAELAARLELHLD